jgi:hypothetical protein
MDRVVVCAVGVVVTVGLSSTAEAATTRYVANNGLDTNTCTASRPCRTITRAIERSSNGDTIIVGPGRYGDGDGEIATPGVDEMPHPTCNDCVIRINKAVRLYSRDGAAATVLDAGESFEYEKTVVRLTASGIVFGKLNKGFTVNDGLIGVQEDDSASGNLIEGNLLVFNQTGADVGGMSTRVEDNKAVNNVINFTVRSESGGAGFQGVSLRGNVANGGFVGFDVQGGTGPTPTLTGNIANGNETGVYIVTDDFTFTDNAVLGNGYYGIAYEGPNSATAELHKNSIFGNALCGLVNFSQASIDASNNFWGDAGGPGDDPADDICDEAGGNINAVPARSGEVKVLVRAIK